MELAHVTTVLEGLEETIISKLIDRAQFRVNQVVYEAGQSGFEGEPHRSLFGIRLSHHEQMDALFGRFCVPEERPFTQPLPPPRRTVHLPPSGLAITDFEPVNVTEAIRKAYLELLPKICRPGDDGQYGSSVEHDVYALQALSRRIHYGALYVAECKFREHPDEYGALAAMGDRPALVRKLTRKDVEERIVERVGAKVASLQTGVNTAVRIRIEPEVVTQFYRDAVIPLTKESEVRYMLHRQRPAPAPHASPREHA